MDLSIIAVIIVGLAVAGVFLWKVGPGSAARREKAQRKRAQAKREGEKLVRKLRTDFAEAQATQRQFPALQAYLRDLGITMTDKDLLYFCEDVRQHLLFNATPTTLREVPVAIMDPTNVEVVWRVHTATPAERQSWRRGLSLAASKRLGILPSCD